MQHTSVTSMINEPLKKQSYKDLLLPLLPEFNTIHISSSLNYGDMGQDVWCIEMGRHRVLSRIVSSGSQMM